MSPAKRTRAALAAAAEASATRLKSLDGAATPPQEEELCSAKKMKVDSNSSGLSKRRSNNRSHRNQGNGDAESPIVIADNENEDIVEMVVDGNANGNGLIPAPTPEVATPVPAKVDGPASAAKSRASSTKNKKELAAKEPDAVQNVRSPPARFRACASARSRSSPGADDNDDDEDALLGDVVDPEEAKKLWPWRFEKEKLLNEKMEREKEKGEETKSKEKRKENRERTGEESKSKDNKKEKAAEELKEERFPAKAHYLQARVDGNIYNLNDTVLVKGESDKLDYIGRIVEFFKGTDGEEYFCCRWFYRAEDTALTIESSSHDDKRVFLSPIMDDNDLACIIRKISVVRVPHGMPGSGKKGLIPHCDYYYDMAYNPAYSVFHVLPEDDAASSSESVSTVCSDSASSRPVEAVSGGKSSQLLLLDLYAGCGGMSTGLCMGAKLSGVNLVGKWAVDMNENAIRSLKHNHPETEARVETAEDFLELLKSWKDLCEKYCEPKDHKINGCSSSKAEDNQGTNNDGAEDDEDDDDNNADDVFEVDSLLAIQYRGPEDDFPGLRFKVRWRGYSENEDTWEPLDGLMGAEEKVKEFVRKGAQSKILPLPGDVDIICGGPPCQGASGFNRFRNVQAPLEDPKNRQVIVYMDIVDFLKPRFVLMENVVDILKFAGGTLGRYALSRLVNMNYQAKLGLMAAGYYGLPQFRMRVFLWGAIPTEKLPKFPLPTHAAHSRGVVPTEWDQNVVVHSENSSYKVMNALELADAISDLPSIINSEERDEMSYGKAPRTAFQKFIRLPKEVMCSGEMVSQSSAIKKHQQRKAVLYDHRPLQLNDDDYQRVCRIPKRKGANFRDLPGVRVKEDNTVELDPTMDRVMLSSGKPLVPDYAITFVQGRSLKPFGRLWWDETVPTVVTRAEPHNQIILHPDQDRVLSIRENARLQGFPDYYKLFGNVKARYIQVGNAVAVPVARALGYAFGLAVQNMNTDESPIMELPSGFPENVGQVAELIANENGVSDVGE